MNNSTPQRKRSGCLITLLLIVLSWIIYDQVTRTSVESQLAWRMRCSYNDSGAEMVKREYNNGVVYYQCEKQ